jgi:glycosyltransferase involved in cell wall biosynthesis
LKILAFSPTDFSAPGGNATTLRRLQRGLAARGHELDLLPVLSDADPDWARREVEARRPDLLHFYHAWKTGRFLPYLRGRPRVLTLSGTDVNVDWDDPVKRVVLETVVAEAEAVVTYSRALAERVPKARILPKGISLGDAPFDLRKAAGVGPRDVLFLQAGGIRPVKNNLLALKGLRGTGLPLVFVGPVLDEACARELEREGGRLLPAVPPEAMAACFRAADVVLNSSHSEGLSNAILEAMACGRPVLVSDVPGNRELIQDGVTGALFRGEAELRAQALRLGGDPAGRRALGDAARAAVAGRTVEKEIDALLEAYRAAEVWKPPV